MRSSPDFASSRPNSFQGRLRSDYGKSFSSRAKRRLSVLGKAPTVSGPATGHERLRQHLGVVGVERLGVHGVHEANPLPTRSAPGTAQIAF